MIKRIYGIQLPDKYKLLEEFIEEMLDLFEKAEKKYGDWRDINSFIDLCEHLVEEYKEVKDSTFSDSKELVDLANCCFLCWAFNPKRFDHLKTYPEKVAEEKRIAKMADALKDIDFK